MSLEECLVALREATREGRQLGLDTAGADGVIARAEDRLRFPGATYVLALAGGTGVGKSSLLNALARRTVSPVRAIRPTTGDPVAWLANTRRHEMQGLLDWLGARHIIGHADADLEHLAIVDLPDFDSIFVDHRVTVERLLPRVDALAWVVDPEKYDDARLHDNYLRPLARHADRFLFVLNKSDRLTPEQREELRADLERRLVADGIDDPPIFVLSAREGTGELDELRETLAAAGDGKALIGDKVSVDAQTAGRQLAIQSGLDSVEPPSPLIPAARRDEAIEEATGGALEVIDLPELTRQAERAVREQARQTGAGLMGRLVSALGRASGHQARVADPVRFLRGWRSRGSVARAANPVRQLASEAAMAAPPGWRPRLMELSGSERVEAAVGEALDRVAAERAQNAEVPTSSVWPVMGIMQVLANAVLLFAILWFIALVFRPGLPVSTTSVGFLENVPTPLVVLLIGALASYLMSAALHAHAGWVGRRWARRIESDVRASVEGAVRNNLLGPLDDLESRRVALWNALQRLRRTCTEDVTPA